MTNTATHLDTNEDKAELQHFSELAAHWWDKTGPLKTLHDVNPCRLAFIQQEINAHHPTLFNKAYRALDVGCGGGILTEGLHQHGINVTGLDLSASLLQVARQHAKTQHYAIEYVEESIEQFAEKHPQTFDLVTCLEMLEHVPNPQSVIEAIQTTLKPGGLLIASTLDRSAFSYATSILAAEYILKIIPPQTHDYNKLIRPAELAALMRHFDFEIQSVKGMSYVPWRGETTLTDVITANYIMSAVKGS